jgi:hypothetical protein
MMQRHLRYALGNLLRYGTMVEDRLNPYTTCTLSCGLINSNNVYYASRLDKHPGIDLYCCLA